MAVTTDIPRRQTTGLRGPEVELNRNVRGLEPSATLAINERCNELRHAGRRVFKLGLGQSPFPIPRPVVDELKAQAHQKDYLAVKGLWDLREAVAHYHARSQGMTCAGEDVLVGPGSKELMFLLQLVFYGDLVIPTPTWVSYAPQAQIKLAFDAIQKALGIHGKDASIAFVQYPVVTYRQ